MCQFWCCYNIDVHVNDKNIPKWQSKIKLFHKHFVDNKSKLPICFKIWDQIYPDIKDDIRNELVKHQLGLTRETKSETFQYKMIHKTQYLLIRASYTRIVVFWTPVTYPQWIRRAKLVVIPPHFVWQQYLWNIAIQPAVGCYNLWANLRCWRYVPLGEKYCETGLFVFEFHWKGWKYYRNSVSNFICKYCVNLTSQASPDARSKRWQGIQKINVKPRLLLFVYQETFFVGVFR